MRYAVSTSVVIPITNYIAGHG